MTTHIRIPAVTPTVQTVADGTSKTFEFPFPIFAGADLEIFVGDTPVASGFTVRGAGSSDGGAVVFATVPAAGQRVTIRRRQAYARTDDFLDERAPTPHELNDAVDQNVAALQELADESALAVRRSPTADLSRDVNLTLPEPEAGKVLGWNGSANALVNLTQVDVSDMLRKSQNLADLPDKAQARSNLGLGSAATYANTDFATAAQGAKADSALQSSAIDIDTALAANSDAKIASQKAVKAYVDGAVAAGDAADLKKAQNLADLADMAAARGNLGLGTSARLDIDTDATLAANSDDRVPSQKAVRSFVVANATSSSVLDRIARLERNLAITVLRSQIDAARSSLNMVNAISDEFEDMSGIASLGGATYDSTGDYIHNLNQFSSDIVPVLTANTNQGWTIESTGTDASYPPTLTPYRLFDGATNAEGWYCWGTSAIITITPPAPKTLFGYGIYPSCQGGRDPKAWTFEGWNGSAWVVLDTQSNHTSGTWSPNVEKRFPIVSPASYGKYRLNISANNGDYQHIIFYELELYEQGSPADVSVSSVASVAASAPNEALVVLLHQPVGAVTLNTDCTIEVSRDNGTTWTAGTLTTEGVFDATTNVLAATINLASQPSGTMMKWRFKTYNMKEQRLHGVWMQWR